MSTDLQKAYVTCALWSSHKGNEPLDSGDFTLSEVTRKKLEEKAQKFWDENEPMIQEFMRRYNVGEAQVGHSLWLSQNGHGAGLFDFGENGDFGGQLQARARGNETYLWVDDENVIHMEGE